MVTIEDVTTTVYRYPTYYNIEYVEKGVPEVRGELLLESGEIERDLERYRFISEETARRFPRVRLEPGDIAMSVRGTIGKIGIVHDEIAGSVITANLIRLAPQREKVYPDYFRWVLLSPKFRKELDAASPQTTIKTITAPALKALPLPLPPLPEQRRIAHVLTTVQTAIEQQARLIALTRELKSTLMRKLFAEGRRGEKQKERRLGWCRRVGGNCGWKKLVTLFMAYRQRSPITCSLSVRKYSPTRISLSMVKLRWMTSTTLN
jgi:type I restriction enzyme S subunit